MLSGAAHRLVGDAGPQARADEAVGQAQQDLGAQERPAAQLLKLSQVMKDVGRGRPTQEQTDASCSHAAIELASNAPGIPAARS